jgi:NAD+ kinase
MYVPGSSGDGLACCPATKQRVHLFRKESPLDRSLLLTRHLSSHSMLAPVSHSPDIDVFTTPPTTPMSSEPPNESIIRPSLSRSISRPSSLNISNTTGDFKPDILLETPSPPSVPSNKSSAPVTTPQFVLTAESDSNGHQKNGQSKPPSDSSDHNSRLASSTNTTTDSTLKSRALLRSQESPTSASMPRSHTHSHNPTMSPCFVHSNLDKGASFSEWLTTSNGFPSRIDIAPILRPMAAEWPQAPPRRYRTLDNGQVIPIPYEDDKVENVVDASDYDYEDDEGSSSLTKQLADTAVGVREMSKQLGASLQTRLPFPKVLNNRIQAARVSDPIFRLC